MTLQGKWRIVEMDLWDADFLDLMEPAYIQFDAEGGEFAFGCVTGAIHGGSPSDSVVFTWDGNNEIDQANGEGWAELQDDGSLVGEIKFHTGDESAFTARPWASSSTAC